MDFGSVTKNIKNIRIRFVFVGSDSWRDGLVLYHVLMKLEMLKLFVDQR